MYRRQILDQSSMAVTYGKHILIITHGNQLLEYICESLHTLNKKFHLQLTHVLAKTN